MEIKSNNGELQFEEIYVFLYFFDADFSIYTFIEKGNEEIFDDEKKSFRLKKMPVR